MFGHWASITAAAAFLLLLIFVLWTIRNTRLRREQEARDARAVHAGRFDDQLRELDLGPMTRGEVEQLMRQSYRASEGHHPSADARMVATHLALFRDKQDYLEIIFIAPDHIDVRASPLIAGSVDEEFVMIGGYPALFSLVDAYYSLPDDFGDHWRSLPNRKTRS